jgi:hypothetical protein
VRTRNFHFGNVTRTIFSPFLFERCSTLKTGNSTVNFIPYKKNRPLFGQQNGTSCLILIFSLQDNNVERAADWLFSHPDELDKPDDVVPASSGPAARDPKQGLRDGSGSKLFYFFSHFFSFFFFFNYLPVLFPFSGSVQK